MAKFEPGQSRNPGGRPKSKELRDALRGFTDWLSSVWASPLTTKNPRVALLAIRELYGRVYGKPLQASEVSIEDDRSYPGDTYPLTPTEVAVSLKELLTTAEKEMGLPPRPEHSNKDRVERLLKQSTPLSPSLYAALQQGQGTRH